MRAAALLLTAQLEMELQSGLSFAWLSHPFDASEIRSVSRVAIRIFKLRMVEEVKEFRPEFKASKLTAANRELLVQRKIKIVDWRTTTNCPFGVSDLAKQAWLVAIEGGPIGACWLRVV